jgi:hypothetical protein
VTDYALFRSSYPEYSHRWVVDLLDQHGLDESAHHYQVPAGITSDPVVMDHVRQMLGDDAEFYGCAHVHMNHASEDGDWHTDVLDEEPFPADYEWAYLFYFPQDTPEEMGPTAVLVDGEEIKGAGPAGTCLLARATTKHRATANTSGNRRYMLKFLFRGRR